MAKKSFLDSIRSPLPCAKDWNEMIGDERVRFCGACAKNVYNLSAMPRREARKFVALNSGKVCVRYIRLPGGKVQTADTKLYKITRRASAFAAGVFGATLTLSALSNAQTPTPPKTEANKSVKSQNKNIPQTSQISFSVYDSNGAVIANAEVKLINQQTKKEFVGLTNQEGIAYFGALPRGKYSLDVPEKFGFASYQQTLVIREPIEPNIKITLSASLVQITGDFIIYEYEIPLFHSIVQDDIETVKNLINSGYDTSAKDSNGQTALHVAVEHGNLEIVRILLEKGARVNAKTKAKQTPILMFEESFGDGDEEKSNIEILRLLIAKGADVNVQNEAKQTILMMACFDDNLEAVKLLLEAGANPNLKDEDGETAIDKTGSEEIKQLLKQRGAKN